MKLLVDRFEAVAVDVGVDLRGGNVGVAEHLLHDPQIGAVGEQMGGERMAQRVGRNRLFYFGGGGIFFQAQPKFLAGELVLAVG